MQFHRLAAFILGIWLGAAIFMDFTATQNFRSVGRVMNSMSVASVENARKVGDPDAVRTLLHSFAGEANAYLFEQWESAELLVGLALLLVLLFGRTYQKLAMAGCFVMMALVAVQRFDLTPHITQFGRDLASNAGSAKRFALYHAAYAYIELSKLALGLLIAARLLIRKGSDKKAFVREYQRERGIA